MNLEELPTILAMKDLLNLYDCTGIISITSSEYYKYKTYVDPIEKCSFVILSKGEDTTKLHLVKAPCDLNSYDKVSEGLQKQIIELIIKDFAHNEKMKILKNDLKIKQKELEDMKKQRIIVSPFVRFVNKSISRF